MRVVWNIIQYTFWTGVVVYIAVSGLVSIPADQPSPLPVRGFIVRSGSMEPTIMTGDVIILSADTTLALDKIITFRDAEQRTVTHRVTAADPERPGAFRTKGDNNQTDDPLSITEDQVVGSYVTRIPLLGYLFAATQSGLGFVLLFAIPLLMIVASELFKPEKHSSVANNQTKVA